MLKMNYTDQSYNINDYMKCNLGDVKGCLHGRFSYTFAIRWDWTHLKLWVSKFGVVQLLSTLHIFLNGCQMATKQFDIEADRKIWNLTYKHSLRWVRTKTEMQTSRYPPFSLV